MAKPTLRGDAAQDEAFRVLRSGMLVALSDVERSTIVITSAQAGEGKTTVSARLAGGLALAGRRVIAVDLDLRHPDLHRRVDGHNEWGVTDVLLERRSLEDTLQFVDVSSSEEGPPRAMYVLAAGSAVNDPTDLLSAGRTARLLAALSSEADVVIIDSPPVLPVADTLVIGRLVTGAVLVVEARKTPWEAAVRAKNALTRNQTRIFGCVLNKISEKDVGPGYGYGYGDPERADQ